MSFVLENFSVHSFLRLNWVSFYKIIYNSALNVYFLYKLVTTNEFRHTE